MTTQSGAGRRRHKAVMFDAIELLEMCANCGAFRFISARRKSIWMNGPYCPGAPVRP